MAAITPHVWFGRQTNRADRGQGLDLSVELNNVENRCHLVVRQVDGFRLQLPNLRLLLIILRLQLDNLRLHMRKLPHDVLLDNHSIELVPAAGGDQSRRAVKGATFHRRENRAGLRRTEQRALLLWRSFGHRRR